jgi:hypothetical protein
MRISAYGYQVSYIYMHRLYALYLVLFFFDPLRFLIRERNECNALFSPIFSFLSFSVNNAFNKT